MPGSEQSNPSPRHNHNFASTKQADELASKQATSGTHAGCREGKAGDGIMRRAGAVGSASCGGEGGWPCPEPGPPPRRCTRAPPACLGPSMRPYGRTLGGSRARAGAGAGAAIILRELNRTSRLLAVECGPPDMRDCAPPEFCSTCCQLSLLCSSPLLPCRNLFASRVVRPWVALQLPSSFVELVLYLVREILFRILRLPATLRERAEGDKYSTN